MVIEFNHLLFLRSNLFYGFCKFRALHDVFLFVYLFVRTEIVYFSTTACRIETNFSPISATTHVECFNDNYDIIGHVVWQPCWKNGKTLDL